MRTGGLVNMAMTIGLAAGLAALAVLRCFAAEYLQARASGALAAREPIAKVDAWVARARWVAPEFAAPAGLRGAAFALWAEQSGGEAGKAIAGLARADLAVATRLSPADASSFAAVSRAATHAGDRRLAGAYAHEAVARRPGYAEFAWAWARALSPDAPERRRAYRAVTELAPDATPQVLDEAAPGMSVEQRRRYVAPAAAAYRAWA